MIWHQAVKEARLGAENEERRSGLVHRAALDLQRDAHWLVGGGPTMSDAGQVASNAGGGTVRHRGARPSGGAKRPDTKKVRVQLHLGEQVSRRLAVHSALVGRNTSRVAEEILSAWLCRFGKGREIFGDPADPTPDESAA